MSGRMEPTHCQRCGGALDGLTITIYNADMTLKEVICGNCDATQRKENYLKTKVLDHHLIMNALLRSYDDDPSTKASILADYDRLKEAIKRFQKMVWFTGGLHVYIKASEYHGHSMTAAGIKAMVYAIAGRVLVTLRDERDTMDVTVIMAETGRKRNGGMQSVCATADQAISLLDTFAKYVKKNGHQFKPDAEVAII